jgi:hypothetical protein
MDGERKRIKNNQPSQQRAKHTEDDFFVSNIDKMRQSKAKNKINSHKTIFMSWIYKKLYIFFSSVFIFLLYMNEMRQNQAKSKETN